MQIAYVDIFFLLSLTSLSRQFKAYDLSHTNKTDTLMTKEDKAREKSIFFFQKHSLNGCQREAITKQSEVRVVRLLEKLIFDCKGSFTMDV